MSDISSERKKSLKSPNNVDVFSMMLDAMSVSELTDALSDTLDATAEDDIDFELIEAYLDALNRKEPMPEMPSASESYTDFRKRVFQFAPITSVRTKRTSRVFRRSMRIGLVAVVAVASMLGCMVVAQAAGVDVFGAMARWTSEVFSLGPIRSPGAVDMPSDENKLPPDINTPTQNDIGLESFQAALDENGVTEVCAPTWLPSEYSLDDIEATYKPDGTLWQLAASFTSESDVLHISIVPYYEEPLMQVQKNDTPVETFEINGFTVYLLENINNNTAAWVTEHYECYVAAYVEKDVLKQIVCSMYENI